jgi:hypothetical protein
VVSDRERAEEALRAAGYEHFPGAAFAGRDVWVKDNGTECVKMIVVDPDGGWFQNDTKGPLSDLPALLHGISPTTTEDRTCVKCRTRKGTKLSSARRWFCEECVEALPDAGEQGISLEQVERVLREVVDEHGKPEWYESRQAFVDDIMERLQQTR